MKKLVLLFAAVFAMTFVSCETKPASDASGSSASPSQAIENVSPSADGENTEVKTSDATDPAKEGEQTSDKNTENKPS